ncbi:MAG TPA: Ig-like domain-containing protein [Candidatus Limnocylindria bacterium]|nr:Ig-like domain-containing protein [Candidatus Limnocylindria bacterium]
MPRGSILRTLVAFAIGAVVLGGILFVATTVDGRPPAVERIRLTHHLTSDDEVALTTTSIQVVFSEAVVHAGAEAAFSIQPEAEGAFSWNANTLVFTPEERLPLETDFLVTIQPGVEDPAGNAMEQEASLAFVTVGHPTVVASQPEPNQDAVPLASAVVLRFSTLMDTASVEEALRISPEIELTPSWSGEVLTLTPVEPLTEGAHYLLSIGTDARDSAGTPLERSFALGFQAVQSGLTAITVMPAGESEGISTRTPIAIVFDRSLDPDTVDDAMFTIEPEVAGSLDVVEASAAAGLVEPGLRILRFQPSVPLQPNTTYQVTLATGLAATDAAVLAEPISWRFTTGAPLTSLSNQIVFLTDRSGIDNLWAMNPDGTGQRQLSAELSPITMYAVSPDGRSLVVGDGARLVSQQADGGGRQVLTPDGVLEIDPAFSPDGTQLAFGRVDPETGGGLGLFTRAVAGGDANPVVLPPELRPPSPTPIASQAVPAPAPILRAPRYSPDGAALAYVDMSGRVGVLELPAARLTTARFAAVSPPAWLPDSTAVLLSGSPGGSLEPAEPGQPVQAMDPDTLGLTSFGLGALRLARLDRGAALVQLLDHPSGASRPEPGPGNRYLFIEVQADAPGAGGTLWVATAGGSAFDVLADNGGPVTAAGYGPEPNDVVAARAGTGVAGGVWLTDVTSGRGEQLAADGRMPRWIP